MRMHLVRHWAARLAMAATIVVAALVASPAQAQTYTSVARAYAWVDPSAHTSVTWAGVSSCSGGGAVSDDDITDLIPIGFTFTYGTTAYTQLRIMSNGRVQFANTFCGYGTQTTTPRTYPYPLPNASLTNVMRAYGADLDASPTGSGTTCPVGSCYVRYAALGTAPNRSFVVSWVNVPEWSAPGSTFTFQVILYENGDFVYQYGASANTTGGAGEVGWQLTDRKSVV